LGNGPAEWGGLGKVYHIVQKGMRQNGIHFGKKTNEERIPWARTKKGG
jgi:hypothetical protein